MPRRASLTFADAKALIAHLGGVEESTSYGTPALKVKKKLIARLREDGDTLVVQCGFDERDLRMQTQPAAFFNEPHYYGYPTLLVRLSTVSKRDLQEVLEVAWRRVAPKSMLATARSHSSPAAPSPNSRPRRATASKKR